MRAACPLLSWLSCALLAAGLIGVEATSPLGAAAIALVLLTTLRLREARRPAGRRAALRQVALLQLITAGLLAALQPELGPSLLQLAATVTALAGLLAEEVGDGAGGRLLLRRSLGLLTAALPMALLVFLLLPRLGPLLPVASGRSRAAVTGLSEQLEPGSIAALASSNAPAARLSWTGSAPPAAGERYWRVLVHRHFDGRRWWHRREPAVAMMDPATGFRREGDSRGSAEAGSQFWLVEGNGLSAVPWSGRGRATGPSLRQLDSGELRDSRPADQRRAYTVLAVAQAPAWQQLPPTAADLALPSGSHPRLEALGASWRRLGPPERRLAQAEAWFRAQPFRYTTSPGSLPEQAALDAFLFQRRQGFCGHYASAFTALMRAAGVPARVVSGYLGGIWVQPLGGEPYLDLRQGDAHAWSEVWMPRRGWVRVDPTGWVAAERRQPTPLGTLRSRAGALLWLQRQWWALDLAWSRWWLGFDQQGQEELLQRLLGERRQWLGALLLSGLALLLAIAVALLRGPSSRPAADGARRELDRVLQALTSAGLEARPGDTLDDLSAEVVRRRPELSSELATFIAAYRLARFAPEAKPGALHPLRRSRRQLLQRLKAAQRDRTPHNG